MALLDDVDTRALRRGRWCCTVTWQACGDLETLCKVQGRAFCQQCLQFCRRRQCTRHGQRRGRPAGSRSASFRTLSIVMHIMQILFMQLDLSFEQISCLLVPAGQPRHAGAPAHGVRRPPDRALRGARPALQDELLKMKQPRGQTPDLLLGMYIVYSGCGAARACMPASYCRLHVWLGGFGTTFPK